MAANKLSDNQIAVSYPKMIISELWAKGQDSNEDLYAAYHPEIDCATGYGNTHDEARSQLSKERYRQYLWGLEHGVPGAGLWK